MDHPKWDNLYPHQQEAVRFLVGKERALLADAAGVGKTPPLCVGMDIVGAKSAVVICPASLRENWARELRRWSGMEPFWFDTKVKLLKGWPEVWSKIEKPVLVASYEQLNAVLKGLQETRGQVDVLVFDESHYMKSRSALRSKLGLCHVWPYGKRCWCASGTPLPNGRASEAFTVFARMMPDRFGDWKKYAAEFCIEEASYWNRWVKVYNKSKNLKLLGGIARENFMLCREIKEVLKDLPDIVRYEIPLTLSGKAIQELAAESAQYIEEALTAIAEGRREWSDSLSTMRRLLSAAKIPASVEFIRELLEDGPVVVFAHHREAVELLKEALEKWNPAVIYGETPANERQKAVDNFQNGKCDVFIGSIGAANTGITLTRSSTVVLVEASFVPGENLQAEGRIYRITQSEISKIYYLYVPNSLDEAITRALVAKEKNIKNVLKG